MLQFTKIKHTESLIKQSIKFKQGQTQATSSHGHGTTTTIF